MGVMRELAGRNAVAASSWFGGLRVYVEEIIYVFVEITGEIL